MKEVEILGHLTTEWDYLFEDFTGQPFCEGNILRISVLVRTACQLSFYLTWVRSSNMLLTYLWFWLLTMGI